MAAEIQTLNNLTASFDNDLFSDCTVVAGGETIPAHRVILARSSYFHAVLTDSKDGNVKRIELPESAATIRFLLKFLYETDGPQAFGNQLRELSFTNLLDLRFAADKYIVQPIVLATDALLNGHVSLFDVRCFTIRPVAAIDKLFYEMIETLHAGEDDVRQHLRYSLIDAVQQPRTPWSWQGMTSLVHKYPNFIHDFLTIDFPDQHFQYPAGVVCLRCVKPETIKLTRLMVQVQCTQCGAVDFASSRVVNWILQFWGYGNMLGGEWWLALQEQLAGIKAACEERIHPKPQNLIEELARSREMVAKLREAKK